MTAAGDATEARSRAHQGPRRRDRRGWRPLLGLAVFLAGLYATVQLTVGRIHDAEGYVPGETDCDDCGLTLVLDHLGWLGLTVGCYLLLALAAWVALRRAASGRPRPATPPTAPTSGPTSAGSSAGSTAAPTPAPPSTRER